MPNHTVVGPRGWGYTLANFTVNGESKKLAMFHDRDEREAVCGLATVLVKLGIVDGDEIPLVVF